MGIMPPIGGMAIGGMAIGGMAMGGMAIGGDALILTARGPGTKKPRYSPKLTFRCPRQQRALVPRRTHVRQIFHPSPRTEPRNQRTQSARRATRSSSFWTGA